MPSPNATESGPWSLRAERLQRLEARVDVLVGVIVVALVERQTADRRTGPGQSSRQSGAIGSASRIASRIAGSRSSSWWSVRRMTSGVVVLRG